MGATVQSSFVSTVVHQLPGPLLRLLDAWSYRIARRRLEQRQQRWLQRKAAPAAAPQPAPEVYHLKPWRD